MIVQSWMVRAIPVRAILDVYRLDQVLSDWKKFSAISIISIICGGGASADQYANFLMKPTTEYKICVSAALDQKETDVGPFADCFVAFIRKCYDADKYESCAAAAIHTTKSMSFSLSRSIHKPDLHSKYKELSKECKEVDKNLVRLECNVVLEGDYLSHLFAAVSSD